MGKLTNEFYDIGGHIKLMPAGRRCSECNNPMSRYNKGDRCFACTQAFIDSIPDAPLKKPRRPRSAQDDPFEPDVGTQAILDALRALEERENNQE